MRAQFSSSLASLSLLPLSIRPIQNTSLFLGAGCARRGTVSITHPSKPPYLCNHTFSILSYYLCLFHRENGLALSWIMTTIICESVYIVRACHGRSYFIIYAYLTLPLDLKLLNIYSMVKGIHLLYYKSNN